MAELQLLNHQDHAALRLRQWDDPTRHFVQIVADEFASAAAHYPIVLTKNPDTGRFYAGAMLGFKPGESLFVDGAGKLGTYRPLDLERQGFFVSGDAIAIDPDHARFSAATGAHLFEEDGRPGEPLRRVQRALTQLNKGLPETDLFLDRMLALRLIEPMEVSLAFDDGEQLTLEGLYTISADRLYELADADALDLFRQGFLQLAFVLIGSVKQVPALARRRNDRLLQAG